MIKKIFRILLMIASLALMLGICYLLFSIFSGVNQSIYIFIPLLILGGLLMMAVASFLFSYKILVYGKKKNQSNTSASLPTDAIIDLPEDSKEEYKIPKFYWISHLILGILCLIYTLVVVGIYTVIERQSLDTLPSDMALIFGCLFIIGLWVVVDYILLKKKMNAAPAPTTLEEELEI